MQALPHEYSVAAGAEAMGNVVLSGPGLPALQTAPPAQFDGPGDLWSPETLFTAAAADCFVLTFRAIARASKLSWTNLQCTATGKLDRVDGMTRFTALKLHAKLIVPTGTDVDKARHLLEKSEKACLITNSLALASALSCEVVREQDAQLSRAAAQQINTID